MHQMLVVLTACFQARTVSGSIVLSLLLICPGYQPGLPAKDCIGNRQLQDRATPSHHRYRTGPDSDQVPDFVHGHRPHPWRLWSRRGRIRGRFPCAGTIAVAGFRGWTIIGEEFIARLYDGGHRGAGTDCDGTEQPTYCRLAACARHHTDTSAKCNSIHLLSDVKGIDDDDYPKFIRPPTTRSGLVRPERAWRPE